MTSRLILFGATGYTGRKTAAAMVARGLRPTLAGRDPERLRRLAAELGELPTAQADVTEPQSLRALLSQGDVLVSTVGPFLRWGQPALDAALAAGAHYIDSTGEPAFVRRVAEQCHGPAQRAHICMLSAFGYDYVPGHTVGSAVLRHAGAAATQLDIGYYSAPGKSFRSSQGTQASLAGAIFDPGIFWRGGRRVQDFGGTRMRSFTVEGRSLDALSVPGSEHLWLPELYPQLQQIGVYLGWFGRRTRTMHTMSRVSSVLLRLPGAAALAHRLAPQLSSSGEGPSEAELADSGSVIVAEAMDADGRVLARATLRGVDGYTYTARMLAWGAQALLAGRHQSTGATGPINAFGLDAVIEANREAGLELEIER